MLKMAEALINNKSLYLEPYVRLMIDIFITLINYNKPCTDIIIIL